MADKYPYSVKVSSVKEFLTRIPSDTVPPKLDNQTLAALGYKSSNDRAIITVLKFIGFLDSSGVPTDSFKRFRNKEIAGAVMAASIRGAYGDLYGLYQDAHNKDNEALRNFFSTRVTAGAPVLELTVNTFKALCQFADFGAAPASGSGLVASPARRGETTVTASPAQHGLVVNLNIQLQLPATEDATIYDKIFESLKKHILEK